MSKFFDDTMQGLLEAVEIEKGNVPLKQREGMPAPTSYVPEDDEKCNHEIKFGLCGQRGGDRYV